MWSLLSENLQRKNGQNCGGWGNRTPLKNCGRDEPVSDCLGFGEKAGQAGTSRHHRWGDSSAWALCGPERWLKEVWAGAGGAGVGDLITFWQDISEPPQRRREQQRGRKEGKEKE